MRYVGIHSAQSVAICVKGYIFVLQEKEIDTRVDFLHHSRSLCRGLVPSYQTALQLGSCKRAGYSYSRPSSWYDRLLKAFLPDQTG